jgi:AbrB family looped-hinge helix DNA binding protein
VPRSQERQNAADRRAVGNHALRDFQNQAKIKIVGHVATDAGFGFPPNMIVSYKMMIDGETVMATKDTAKLSTKFQISIPKAIRTARGWQAGQVFAFVPKGEGMMLVPVPALDELAGLARGAKQGDYRDRTDRV